MTFLEKSFLSFDKNKVLFFISHMVYNFGLFILTIIAAKLTGPENWGLITLFSLIATYSSIFTLGINNGMGIMLPISIGKKNSIMSTNIAITSRRILLFSFIPIGLVQISLIIFLDLPLLMFIVLYIFTISVQLLTYFKFFLRSHQSFKIFSYAYLFQTVLLMFGIFILQKGFNYLIILSISNFITILFIWKKIKNINSNWEIEKKTIYRIIKIGFPIMMAGIVGELLLSTDRLIISFFLSNSELGQYGFGSNFFKGIRIIGIAISTIALPKIATSYSNKDLSKMIYYARIQQWISFLFMALASIITGLFIFYLVPTLLPEYSKSINLSLILLIASTLLPLSLYPNILNVIGKQKLYLKIQLFIIFLNLFCSTTFIILGYGIDGVAVGSLLSMIFYVILIRYLGSKSIKNLSFNF